MAKGMVDEPATASIAAATLQDHRAIAREMAAQIVGEIATYSEANNSHELLRATEDSCDAHIQSFCRSVLDRLGPEELEIGFTAESVADRVRQGIPLESILHAYRIGHRVLWATLEERAATAGEDRVAIVPLVAPSIRYIDAVSTMVAEIYLREQQHELADADRARRDVLELLLAGSSEALPAAAAAGIQIEHGAPHQVLLAQCATPSEIGLRSICSEISGIFAQDAPLVVMRHQSAVALVRCDGETTLSRARRLAERFDAGGGIRVGVSLDAMGLIPGAREAYRQAERALQVAGSAEPVVGLGGMAAIDYLVGSADEVAKALVPPEVAELAASPVAADVDLVRTFIAYVANNSNIRRTAAALPAHANTVRARLRRLADRTGYDPRNPNDIVRLLVDLRLAGEQQPPSSP